MLSEPESLWIPALSTALKSRGERPAGRAQLLAKRVNTWAHAASAGTGTDPLVPPEGFLGTSGRLRKAPESCCILEKSRKIWSRFSKNSAKFWQHLRNFCQIRKKKQQIFNKKIELRERTQTDSTRTDQVLFAPWFSRFLGFDSKTVQRSALCRSRRELSNECLVFICKIWLRYSRERAL